MVDDRGAPRLEMDPIEVLAGYVQIDTSHPAPAYYDAVEYLKVVLSKYVPDAELSVTEFVKGKPMLHACVKGLSEEAVLLSSHMDVVPVSRDLWQDDPFCGNVTPEGEVYGRGVQDMKSVGVAYIAALSKIERPLKRTIHLLFTVDEEIGSGAGMAALAKSGWFGDRCIVAGLDEGAPSPFENLFLFNGERPCLPQRFIISGSAGHGSAFVQDSAVDKLMVLLQRIHAFKLEQIGRMKEVSDLGNVTTVNPTVINGGKQFNVIPDRIELIVDMRVSHDLGVEGLGTLLQGWLEGLKGVTVEPVVPPLPGNFNVSSLDSPVAVAIHSTLEEMGIGVQTGVFPGATDGRFLRALNVPVFGLSPFRNTPILCHDHNERLPVKAFLEAVHIYERLLNKLVK